MSKFPLYDSLSKDIPKKDLTVSQKRSFLKKIEKIDEHGHELLYVLIRSYQLEDKSEEMNYTIPYGGIAKGNEISFDISELPRDLRHILYRFLDVHTKKMKEEEKMEKMQANTPGVKRKK